MALFDACNQPHLVEKGLVVEIVVVLLSWFTNLTSCFSCRVYEHKVIVLINTLLLKPDI